MVNEPIDSGTRYPSENRRASPFTLKTTYERRPLPIHAKTKGGRQAPDNPPEQHHSLSSSIHSTETPYRLFSLESMFPSSRTFIHLQLLIVIKVVRSICRRRSLSHLWSLMSSAILMRAAINMLSGRNLCTAVTLCQ